VRQAKPRRHAAPTDLDFSRLRSRIPDAGQTFWKICAAMTIIRRRSLPYENIDLSIKVRPDRAMTTKTIALSLGLILVAGALYAADPFEGTWKLNESKSKLTRGTLKNTKVVYNSRLIRDKVTITADGVDADGKPVHSEWKGRFNGKDYEVTGDPNADTRSYTKVNDQTLNAISKKGGQVVAQSRIAVSGDGKNRVVTVNGTTAKGKKFTNTAVYDKE
jgi:hypothetical protein